MSPRRWSDLRRLLPCILAMGFAADVGLRLVPPERFAFRAWEALTLRPTAEGPFAPGRAFHTDRAFGDLANIGNLPAYRRYRAETFTTDAHGFRVPGAVVPGPVRVVLFGDSYGAGAALSDEETFTAQLGTRFGIATYDAAGRREQSVIQVVRRLGLRGGWVVWEELERADPPPAAATATTIVPPPSGWTAVPRLARRVVDGSRARLAYSPLRILLGRAYRVIQDDRWLPNVPAAEVVQRALTDGERILFLASEVAGYGRTRPVDAAGYEALDRAVASTGNRLLVLLVPDKYDVYAPLLTEAPAEPAHPYLDRLAAALNARGVAAISLRAALRTVAAEARARGADAYRTDDSHWGPLAVRSAAIEAGTLMFGAPH